MMWMDGSITDGTQVPFNLMDRGLLLGDGLFETLLVLGGTPFRFDAHLARLAAGAERLHLTVDLATVRQAVLDLAAQLDGPGAVRVTVTRGAGPRGLAIPAVQSPTIFATAAPWSPTMAFRPQRLHLSSIRRNDSSPLSGIKALNYLDNILALDAATKAGADDALLLSTRGHVACTAVANIFVLQGTELITPPLTDGVLPGTMRALLLNLAASCGLTPRERSLSPNDLRGADAVITSNSLRLLSRAVSLDEEPLGAAGSEALNTLVAAIGGSIAQECGWTMPIPADLFC